MQLKNFSAIITKSIARNKKASQIRETEKNIVKKEIESIEVQNPFVNKSLAEARTGAKINLST